jgi:hypothetical protein
MGIALQEERLGDVVATANFEVKAYFTTIERLFIPEHRPSCVSNRGG